MKRAALLVALTIVAVTADAVEDASASRRLSEAKHIDVLVSGLDFSALSAQAKTSLSTRVGGAIAGFCGITNDQVMSLGRVRGAVDFQIPARYAWSPETWYPPQQGKGVVISAILALPESTAFIVEGALRSEDFASSFAKSADSVGVRRSGVLSVVDVAVTKYDPAAEATAAAQATADAEADAAAQVASTALPAQAGTQAASLPSLRPQMPSPQHAASVAGKATPGDDPVPADTARVAGSEQDKTHVLPNVIGVVAVMALCFATGFSVFLWKRMQQPAYEVPGMDWVGQDDKEESFLETIAGMLGCATRNQSGFTGH